LRAFRLALGCATLPTEVEVLLKSIRPTRWHGSKVSGIDLGSDFAWIDDSPLTVEIDALRAHDLQNRLIVTDTNKDNDALPRAIEALTAELRSAMNMLRQLGEVRRQPPRLVARAEPVIVPCRRLSSLRTQWMNGTFASRQLAE